MLPLKKGDTPTNGSSVMQAIMILEMRQALTRAYAATFTKQSGQLPGLKEERPEYQEIASQVLQDVLRRVDAAFDRFFERVKEGKLLAILAIRATRAIIVSRILNQASALRTICFCA